MKTLLPRQAYPLIFSLFLLIALMVGLDFISDQREYESEALILHGIPSVPAIGGWPEAFRSELKGYYSDLLDQDGREEALERLAYLYHANGFVDEAYHAYQALRLAHPFEPRWPYLLGVVKSDYSEQESVIKHFEATIKLEPEARLTRYRLAQAYAKDQDFDRAKETLNTPEFAKDPLFLLLKGEIAVREERFEDAIPDLASALEQDRGIKEAYELLAEAYLNIGDSVGYKEALWNFDHVEVESEIIDPRLLPLRSYCYDTYKLRQYAKISLLNDEPLVALDLLQRALEIDPEDFEASFMLAEVAKSSGSFDLASAFFRRAREIDPRDDQTYLEAARIHVDLFEYKEAIKELENGLKESSYRSDLFLELGKMLLRVGDPEKAEEAFRAALREDSDSLRAMKGLGLYLFQRNEGEGRKLLEAYLSSVPNDAEVASLLRGL